MVSHLNEIEPGLILYLDPAILQEFGVRGPRWMRGVHPFVCLEVNGDQSAWAALSSSSLHGARHRIDPAHKRGRTQSWLERDTFIYGCDYWYFGPSYAFQEASRDTERSMPHKRNSVNPEGLEFIKAYVHYSMYQIGGAA